jgi:hypothetical protein
MRRIVLMFVCGFLFMTLTAVVEAQSTVIDQMQAVVDDSVGGMAIGGTSDQRLAQTVTVGVSGRLIGIMLPVACESGRLVIEIRDVVGGEPGDNILSRRRIRAERIPDLGATFQLFRVRGGGLHLMAGDQFAIVLDNRSGGCGIFRGPVGDSYSGGQGLFEALPNPPGWVPFSETEDRLDLPFMTLVRVP